MKRNRMGKSGLRFIISFALALALVMGAVPMDGIVTIAHAELAAVKTITGLGTGAIAKPVSPDSDGSAWSGSYVYYGTYNDASVKYRVLDPATNRFGGNTMFLDCESVLFNSVFRTDAYASDANQWAKSDVFKALNAPNDDKSFLNTSFSKIEKTAIAESRVATHRLVEGEGAGQVSSWTKNTFVGYTPLTGEKIFLLDAEDASNIDYGYSTTNGSAENRKKTGSVSRWWLRSPDYSLSLYAGCVHGDGGVADGNVDAIAVDVSPAFNVNLSSVIFSSLISGTAGEPGAKYKLTIKDSGLSVLAGSVTKNADNVVSIPYNITVGANSTDPTQLSVVVTDGEWTENGWSDGANLLQYEKLAVDTLGTSGTGTFTLNTEKASGTWGSDYHVYILAENVHTGDEEEIKLTDYASAPVKIDSLTVNASATGYEGTYDGKAHGITVSVTDPANEVTIKYGETAESCTAASSPTIMNVSDSPKTVYYQVEAEGYLTASGSATVTITPKSVKVNGITANDKTYDGTTDATFNCTSAVFDGRIGSDELTVKADGTFADVNAGENKTVNINNLVLGGAAAGNYELAESGQQTTATATISKAGIPTEQINAPAKIENLKYTGSAQNLITAGSVKDNIGTMHYAVTTTNTAPADNLYITSIPTATNAGTYYVWYKVIGDANHLDYIALQPIAIMIAAGGETEARMEQRPLDSVPAELAHLYGSVEEIRRDMMLKVSINGEPVKAENTFLYDVALLVSFDGGRTWQPATEENFPAEGIQVTLAYPAGTNGNDFDFAVSHMFTVTSRRLGTTAGGIEVPAVTKTAEGLRVLFRGLSPVLVSWARKGEKPEPSPTVTIEPTATPAPTAMPGPVPKTGDRANPVLWLGMIAAGLAMAIAARSVKKRRDR